MVGHYFFEHPCPALLDKPLDMVMGSMLIVTKLLFALCFPRDLAAFLSEQASDKAPVTECGWQW
jgi:uncharacterized membrane protein YGL010W